MTLPLSSSAEQLTSLFTLLICSALTAAPALAQECVDDRVAIEWTQPPRVPIEDDSSLRWPVEGGVKVAYSGTWCPSADQVSFRDVDGAEIPALLITSSAEQLVGNGPLGLNLLTIKPLMSLAERVDYTVVVEPPNARLREFERVELSFKTHNRPLTDLEGFEGLREVKLRALCGEGYVDVDAEDFECVVPSHFFLTLSFSPLPNPEVTYAIYRVSSTAFNEEGQAIDSETDEEERLVGFIPGVTAEAAERSINTRVATLYAPLPREECYRVEVWDEWGRARSGGEPVCVQLTQPVGCPMGCDPEGGDCTFIFATPEPFSVNEPLEGSRCEQAGIHDAPSDTSIPEVGSSSEPDEGGAEAGGMEAEYDEGDEKSGCQALPQPVTLGALLIALLLLRRRPSAL